jgi:hypothetical protein
MRRHQVITIGIDPHKSSHTAVALDPTGRVVGESRLPATKTTLERLLCWAVRWPDRIWAIEGASGLGHLLAQRLVASGETVFDVPATLAARVRLLARGHGRKTDGIDAASVARVAQSQPDLRRVGPEDQSVVLRLLSDRRDRTDRGASQGGEPAPPDPARPAAGQRPDRALGRGRREAARAVPPPQ